MSLLGDAIVLWLAQYIKGIALKVIYHTYHSPTAATTLFILTMVVVNPNSTPDSLEIDFHDTTSDDAQKTPTRGRTPTRDSSPQRSTTVSGQSELTSPNFLSSNIV